MIGQISLTLALRGAAAVFGRDVSLCAVGRTELTRVSDAALVETMDARALQERWDSVIVALVFLVGFAVVRLAAALVRSAQ